MNLLMVAHVMATWALVGLIWQVQCVQYPLFEKVGRENFTVFHAQHCRRIGWVVGPLMLAEAGSAAVLLWMDLRAGWFLAGLPLMALIWASTALVQVPLHERLVAGFSEDAAARLVRTNWVRTIAWSLRGLLSAYGML
mgnify:CR=1 FL=1